MLKYLNRLGFSEITLFGDVAGLARANSVNEPLLKWRDSENTYRERGSRAYRNAEYDMALKNYEDFAELNITNSPQPYCLIGDTLAELKRFEKAGVAYRRALEKVGRPVSPNESETYGQKIIKLMFYGLKYNLGNVCAAVGDHRDAVENYGEALEFSGDAKREILYNRGNSNYCLQKFEESYKDFEAVWLERQGSDAALAMGNCNVRNWKIQGCSRKLYVGN